MAALDASPIRRLIVDLRQNTGGTSLPFLSLVLPEITSRPKLNTADRLFVLIDEGTFSSGSGIAAAFRLETNATLVGMPTGGPLNAYGEVRSFLLPNSQRRVYYSTALHQRDPASTADAIEPDHRIQPSYADHYHQRDPVLEFALQR